MKKILLLAILSISALSEAKAEDSGLEGVRLAIEQQRQDYREVAAQWEKIVRNHGSVERRFALAQRAVAVCKKTVWSGIFSGVFENLEERRKTLEETRTEINKVSVAAYALMSNQTVKVRLLDYKYPPAQRGANYYGELSAVTADVMTGYYAPMKGAGDAMKNYQRGFNEISDAMNSAAADCKKGLPHKAVITILGKFDILDAIIKAIKDKVPLI